MQRHPINIDEQSFRYYYDLYFNDLCKSLNYYTSHLEVIEDTVQDVFVKLWENRENVEIAHIQTYLLTAVRNKMLNLLRDSKQFEVPLELQHIELIATEEEHTSFNEELFSFTQEAINALPEKCKEVFLLSKRANHTYKQIADEKQISVKTVENQMGIAFRKIREYVAKKAALSVMLIVAFCAF